MNSRFGVNCIVLGSLILVLAGCQSETLLPEEAQVTSAITSAKAKVDGYAVTIHFANTGNADATLEVCRSPLQVKRGDAWESAETLDSDAFCPLLGALLPGGGTTEVVLGRLDLHPGDTLRFVTRDAAAAPSNPSWPVSPEYIIAQ